ncbi:hypothetical protein K501DRAFT_241066 [Backusella circina FSU 941]|nr:hypothetical protein K501DRAFT_241066 [Backusella circina FSU 941]
MTEGQSTKLNQIKSVCVFCGSGDGADPIFVEQAKVLGKTLAENNIRLVYGGGSKGIMGTVAKAVSESNGSVLGVVPKPMYRPESKYIGETVLVPDMHSRKKRMADESDAFIVLPGGYGTMEEMLEMITWNQLNIFSKPIILLNTKNFFEFFVKWIQVAVEEQFIKGQNENIFVNCNSVDEVLSTLETYKAPTTRYTHFDWSSLV